MVHGILSWAVEFAQIRGISTFPWYFVVGLLAGDYIYFAI